jgi:DNA ligase-1
MFFVNKLLVPQMEYKYDGERAQVHLLENGAVKIYSRSSEDNSEKYPDLRDIVKYVACTDVLRRLQYCNYALYCQAAAFSSTHVLSCIAV